jgi:hypothetical protein
MRQHPRPARSADEPGRPFIDAIEVMIAMERYSTPEQLDQIEERP